MDLDYSAWDKMKLRPFTRLKTDAAGRAGLFFWAVLALMLFTICSSALCKNVAIVSIDEEESTLRTIKGIKKALKSSGATINFHEVILNGHPQHDGALIKDLTSFDPDVYITIGSYATQRISMAFPAKPIVFANVMNPQASGFIKTMVHPGGRITGAALDIPAEKQFHYFQRVVGNLNKIGVIYSEETSNIIEHAQDAASELGIQLIAVKVTSEKEIPGAIDSLCGVSDALWSVADHTIYTPHSTQHIILQTLRRRLPMMGFSQAMVEAGGLFTLDFDFKDIGRQAGETATRVLAGTSPGEIAVTTPGVIYFKYNEKTAERISIKIPDDLLAVAKEVVK